MLNLIKRLISRPAAARPRRACRGNTADARHIMLSRPQRNIPRRTIQAA